MALYLKCTLNNFTNLAISDIEHRASYVNGVITDHIIIRSIFRIYV